MTTNTVVETAKNFTRTILDDMLEAAEYYVDNAVELYKLWKSIDAASDLAGVYRLYTEAATLYGDRVLDIDTFEERCSRMAR